MINRYPDSFSLGFPLLPCLLFLFGTFFYASLSAQAVYTRVEADFSMKEKTGDGGSSLTMGKVYFDKSQNKIVYNITFPKAEILISTDSFLYKIEADSLVEKLPNMNITKFSVLSLCLSGELPYFGLRQTPYKMTDVDKDGEMVISSWLPPEDYADTHGKMILSQKQKQLYGLISLNPGGDIIAKQFFRKYELISGLHFPTEIIALTYHGGTERKQITTYRNITLNQMQDETFYTYPVPAQ
ncbi:MAG: hypothetical protein AAF587_01160 [Bacteroidota bacterium]